MRVKVVGGSVFVFREREREREREGEAECTERDGSVCREREGVCFEIERER